MTCTVLHFPMRRSRIRHRTSVITESDLRLAASVLVHKHGVDAPRQLSARIDQLLRHGDTVGREIWRRILAATEELLHTQTRGTGR